MNKLYVILLTIATNAFAADISSILMKTSDLTGYNRVIATTEVLLETPYQAFPLGEGENAEIANKPLYSLSVFDCLTFVETTLAFSFAKTPQDFLKTLNDIRYHSSNRNFTTRNHFMSTEWNYYNEKKAYIADITGDIASTKTVTTTIQKPKWLTFLANHPEILANYSNDNHIQDKNILLKYAKEASSQTVNTKYIEIENILDENGSVEKTIYDKLPKIFIVEVVRKDWHIADKIGTDLDISHIGFGIKTKDGLIFRHASTTEGKVVSTPFAEYFLKQAKQKTFAGINILRINLSYEG